MKAQFQSWETRQLVTARGSLTVEKNERGGLLTAEVEKVIRDKFGLSVSARIQLSGGMRSETFPSAPTYRRIYEFDFMATDYREEMGSI